MAIEAPKQLLEQRSQPAGKWFWWWRDRIAPAVTATGACRACAQTLRPGARFCHHCGNSLFAVGASDEVEMPAGRTLRLAEGMLLGRYDPRCDAARWRTQPDGSKTTDAPLPALVLVGLGETSQKEQVTALRPLAGWSFALAWGPRFELLPLEFDEKALRLLVRRVG